MSQSGGLPHDFAAEFKPGDKMVFEMNINIMFESKLIEYQLEKMIGMVDGVEKLLKSFKAVQTAVKALDKLTSTVTKCVKAIDDFTPSIADPLSEKAKLFNTLRNQLYGLASAYGTTGNKTADAALKLANSGLDGVYTAIFEDPEQWFNKTSVEEMKKIVDNTKTLTEKITSSGTTTSKFDIFDSIRTVISAIPVRFALRRVFMIEDEDNTTSIPWSYSTTHAGPQYFGVSSVSNQLYSILTVATSDYISDQMPGYFHLIPGVDDALDTSDTKEYIKAIEAEIARVQAKDATGKITWKAYIIPAAKNTTNKARTKINVANNFTLSSDNETAIYENGVLTFTGPGMIEIIPSSTENGTLVIENSEGYTYTYVIEVVEAHECVARKQETIISPTSEDDGFAVQCCEICGDVMDIVILEYDMCEEHSFSKWISEMNSTCSIGGMKTHECAVCGYVETVFTDKINHTEEVRNYVKETCTTDGYSGDTYCSVCEELISLGETIEASGHDYASVVTKPTCTTDGYTTHTCTVCGDSYIGSNVKAVGHTKVAIGEAGKATCTDDGITAGIKCSVCSEIIEAQQLIKANGHKYVSIVTKSTCTTDGYTTHTCSVCGDTYTSDVVAKTGHSWTWVIDKDANCGSVGYEHQICANCAAVQSENTVISIAENHNYNVGIVIEKPSCMAEGKLVKTCSTCGNEVEEVLSKTEHIDKEGDGYCDECGAELSHQNAITHCSCNCHKSGFTGFIWKIQCFFYKLFKTNQTCSCGVKHW